MFDAFASGDRKNHKIHTNNAFIDTTAMQEKLGGRLLFLLFPEWEEGYKIVHSEIKRKFPKWAFIEGKLTKNNAWFVQTLFFWLLEDMLFKYHQFKEMQIYVLKDRCLTAIIPTRRIVLWGLRRSVWGNSLPRMRNSKISMRHLCLFKLLCSKINSRRSELRTSQARSWFTLRMELFVVNILAR